LFIFSSFSIDPTIFPLNMAWDNTVSMRAYVTCGITFFALAIVNEKSFDKAAGDDHRKNPWFASDGR
jgi:hypothetical protein